jgi:hypothetical protein
LDYVRGERAERSILIKPVIGNALASNSMALSGIAWQWSDNYCHAVSHREVPDSCAQNKAVTAPWCVVVLVFERLLHLVKRPSRTLKSGIRRVRKDPCTSSSTPSDRMPR